MFLRLTSPQVDLASWFQTYRGARQSFVFSKTLCDQLRGQSRKEGIHLFHDFIGRLSNPAPALLWTPDICRGFSDCGAHPCGDRGTHRLFYQYANVKNGSLANPTFVELLGRVRQMALDVDEHQDIPFEKLVERRTPSRQGLEPKFAVPGFVRFSEMCRDILHVA